MTSRQYAQTEKPSVGEIAKQFRLVEQGRTTCLSLSLRKHTEVLEWLAERTPSGAIQVRITAPANPDMIVESGDAVRLLHRLPSTPWHRLAGMPQGIVNFDLRFEDMDCLRELEGMMQGPEGDACLTAIWSSAEEVFATA